MGRTCQVTRGSLRQIMCKNGEYKKQEILMEELNIYLLD